MPKRERKGNPSPPAPRGLPAGVKLLRTLRGHTGWIGRIAWSPDGRMLASPSYDHSIRLWDAETGECLRTIDGHEDEVNAVAFAPTGRTLASLIGKRMIGTEAGKEAVLPALLEGTPESAFPVLLRGRVYADFRKVEAYFDTVFELILSLYQIPPRHAVAEELRNSLRGEGFRDGVR